MQWNKHCSVAFQYLAPMWLAKSLRGSSYRWVLWSLSANPKALFQKASKGSLTIWSCLWNILNFLKKCPLIAVIRFSKIHGSVTNDIMVPNKCSSLQTITFLSKKKIVPQGLFKHRMFREFLLHVPVHFQMITTLFHISNIWVVKKTLVSKSSLSLQSLGKLSKINSPENTESAVICIKKQQPLALLGRF